MPRNASAALATLLAVAVTACHHGFDPKSYKGTHEQFYQAALKEYNRGHWENSEDAFERLTLDLPAGDTLLPRAHWYLAKTQYRRHEYLLAAESFGRFTDLFPADTLAPYAMFESAHSYQKMWRKPDLDADEGQSALSTYEALLRAYPGTAVIPRAEHEIVRLHEWFAQKDYDNGVQYMRRKAYDSAIIYFKDVLRLYPGTSQARRSMLQLHEAYTRIHYRDDAAEACAMALQTYPDDREVRETCHTQAAAVTPPRPTPPLIVPNDSVAAHGDSATGRPPR